MREWGTYLLLSNSLLHWIVCEASNKKKKNQEMTWNSVHEFAASWGSQGNQQQQTRKLQDWGIRQLQATRATSITALKTSRVLKMYCYCYWSHPPAGAHQTSYTHMQPPTLSLTIQNLCNLFSLWMYNITLTPGGFPSKLNTQIAKII